MNQNNTNLYEKKYFFLDSIQKGIEGFTSNARWNGWECPSFTKEIAIEVLESVSSESEEINWYYDEQKDTFILVNNVDNAHDTWKGFTIEHSTSEYKVYSIGLGWWSWEELTKAKYNHYKDLDDSFQLISINKEEPQLKCTFCGNTKGEHQIYCGGYYILDTCDDCPDDILRDRDDCE
ncbi:hypothetical protein [Gottfriedia solisilvae]|uniref:hypothetical protein n=1 Tax=Gottfriedia solisilvae TaxID=1516104 RepID=UPI003D2F1566